MESVLKSTGGVMGDKIVRTVLMKRAGVRSIVLQSQSSGATTTSVSAWPPVPGVMESCSVRMGQTSSRVPGPQLHISHFWKHFNFEF